MEIELVVEKIDLTKTLTPEEKFEIITRNLQVLMSIVIYAHRKLMVLKNSRRFLKHVI